MRTDGKEYSLHSSPRRRASSWIAEGFSPTARGEYRIYCSISISPHCVSGPAWSSPRSGRASARTRNVAPAQAGFALESRNSTRIGAAMTDAHGS